MPDKGESTWYEPLSQQEEEVDFGPIAKKEFEAILEKEESEREFFYAKMIDRYKDVHDFYRKSSGDLDSKPAFLESLDRRRDLLHKQLEQLGLTIGKSKDMVLGDLLCREGNLGDEYLPQYGLITADEIEDTFGFESLAVDRIKQTFSRGISAEEKINRLTERREWEHDSREGEVYEEEEPRIWKENVPGVGEVDVFASLQKDEVAILFGSTFTIDIARESVDITPPTYWERQRRAVRFAEKVGAKVFSTTVGAYHNTVTTFGIAIPASRIKDVAHDLRVGQDEFGILPGQMDPEEIEKDRKAMIVKAKEENREHTYIGYLHAREQYYKEKLSDEIAAYETASPFDKQNESSIEDDEYAEFEADDDLPRVGKMRNTGQRKGRGQKYSRKPKHNKPLT